MKTQGETRMWRYVTAIMVGLLCAQGALATSPNDCQPLDVYMRSAKIYMGAQGAIPDFKSAQKQLDKAIECYPTTLEARFLLSKIMWNKRLYDQFLDLARALDTLDHQRQFMDTIWQMRRAAWGELFNKGVDSLKASNQIDLDRAKAQESGAHAEFDSLTNVGRRYLESAKGLFLASLDMDSSRSEPYQNLGVIDVRLQNWNDALVWYRKSLATKPTDPDLMRNMVSLNLRLDQQDSALHYVHAILLAQPDDLEQLTNLAGLYAKKGFADSANLVFEEIIAKDPNNKRIRSSATASRPTSIPRNTTNWPAPGPPSSWTRSSASATTPSPASRRPSPRAPIRGLRPVACSNVWRVSIPPTMKRTISGACPCSGWKNMTLPWCLCSTRWN
jgi:tetratricopeptide (TPR) repeat protein